MKRIIKRKSPEWFETWKDDFERENHRKAHYNHDFSTDDEEGGVRRIKLRKALIEEQGNICCYCMNRITVNDSHIEHFWPKDEFGEMDLDYENLLASCNGETSLLAEDEHCGHRKNNWWRKDMISPVRSEVENLFKYLPDGRIQSSDRKSNIAGEMIHNFGLDSYHLERNRRQAIENSEVFDEEEYTEEEIQSFIDFYSHQTSEGYVPYCQAIVDCLEEML